MEVYGGTVRLSRLARFLQDFNAKLVNRSDHQGNVWHQLAESDLEAVLAKARETKGGHLHNGDRHQECHGCHGCHVQNNRVISQTQSLTETFQDDDDDDDDDDAT